MLTINLSSFEFPCHALVKCSYSTYWPAEILSYNVERKKFNVLYSDLSAGEVPRARILRTVDKQFYTCRVRAHLFPPLYFYFHPCIGLPLTKPRGNAYDRWVNPKQNLISLNSSSSVLALLQHFSSSSRKNFLTQRNGTSYFMEIRRSDYH